MVKIEATADLKNLKLLTGFIESSLKKITSNFELLHDLILASEEIIVNIILYSYPEEKGLIKVWIFLDKNSFVSIVIKDHGQPFNPLEKQEPDLAASLDQRAIGGLGIFLVKKLVDDISYCRKNNSNILILKKKLHKEAI